MNDRRRSAGRAAAEDAEAQTRVARAKKQRRKKVELRVSKNGAEYDPAGMKPGKFTPEKRKEFLEHFAAGSTVAQAARRTGVSAVTVFNHLRKNPVFARKYGRALETNTDLLEDGLHHLARNGNIAAIFGTLKARRPERWRDRVDVSNKDGSLLKPLAEAIKRAHGIGVAQATQADADDGEARTH